MNENTQTPEEPDEENTVQCHTCDNTIHLEDDGYHQGQLIGYVPSYRVTSMPGFSWDNLYYCEQCYRLCNDCREPAYGDSMMYISQAWDEHYVCDYCCEYYSECSECGETRHHDNMCWSDDLDGYFCNGCYETTCARSSNLVHYYSWDPSHFNFWVVDNSDNRWASMYSLRFDGLRGLIDLPRWNGWAFTSSTIPEEVRPHRKELFMGFELETNIGSCRNIGEAAESLMDADNFRAINGNSEEYMYLKEDGSISGFEIVSHPATLEAHKVLFPADAIRALAKTHGMSSWAGAGAGLHVHVSKSAFTHAHLHKFQLFHYGNAYFLKKFAGRDSGRWASFSQTTSSWGNPIKLSTLAKGQYERTSLNRYHALNFCPPETVELRYFRASLDPRTVIAVLEMVHAIWKYTMTHNSGDYRNNRFSWSNFRSWLATQDSYEALLPTMDKRGV